MNTSISHLTCYIGFVVPLLLSGSPIGLPETKGLLGDMKVYLYAFVVCSCGHMRLVNSIQDLESGPHELVFAIDDGSLGRREQGDFDDLL